MPFIKFAHNFQFQRDSRCSPTAVLLMNLSGSYVFMRILIFNVTNLPNTLHASTK